jgi:3-phenylpropionate/trans-cinnamate dioxygenase ferredoxin subunit
MVTEWHAVASAGEIAPGEVKHVEIGDVEIGVYNLDGEYFAISDVCSHAYARLSEGEVYADEGMVECPLHGAEFEIRTGQHLSFPATEPVQKYEVRLNGDAVEVALS